VECATFIVDWTLSFVFGLSLRHLKMILIIYQSLPDVREENWLIGLFVKVWTPFNIVTHCCMGWNDERSQIMFLLTYVGWLGICGMIIHELGAMLKAIRELPKFSRRRTGPKVKMKKSRRHRYPFYKRNQHRKRARLKKVEQQESKSGWGSVPIHQYPIQKVLHKIGDKLAKEWDEACNANKGLLDLAMNTNILNCSSTRTTSSEFLFNVEDQVVDLTKITDTGQMFRFQVSYWLNSEGHRIIFDSGASVTITPFEEDFISIDKSKEAINNIRLEGITAKAAVKGVGRIRLLVYTDGGFSRYIETEAYWVPSARIRLLSLLRYTKEIKGGAHFRCDENGSYFQFSNKSGGGRITFDEDSNGNLPATKAYYQKQENSSKKGQLFSVLGRQNINLTDPQKELLKIHFCLGHWNLQWIQGLIRKGIVHCSDKRVTKPEAICQCAACNLAKQTKRPEGTVKQTIRPEKDGNLKKNQLRVGGMVSSDQYVSAVPGRLQIRLEERRNTNSMLEAQYL
jgi:hypothetical protein